MPFLAWTDRLRRRVAARARRHERQRSEFVRLGLARLEDRVVLDGAGVVTDLQPGTGSSNPSDLTAFNGSYYFTADGTNASGQSVGRELFRLNADGTVTLVADINPGTAGSNPGDFTLFDPNGSARMLFAATGLNGRELYQLDANGNVTQIFDINPGPASSDPVMLTEFSGKLYFTAFTSATGREAYVVNNGGNVSLIADLNPGSASSDPSALFLFAGNLYFSAEVSGTRQLFREAPSGTSDPVLVPLGTGVSDPRDFVTFNNRLYFSALDPADGRELFAMAVSGNNNETVTKVANLDGSSASSSPGDFFVFGQNLYFSATGASGRELFRLSTSGAITQLDLAPGSASSSPSGFVAFQGDLYFAATVGGTRGLWRLDTSTPALAAVAVPLPGGAVLPQEAVFYALADELFFAADGPAGRELYRMTPARVVSLAADVNAGPASSNPAEVILFGGKVYFVATEAAVGRELFVLRRDPSSIRIDGGKLVFNDDAGDKDNRLEISSTGTHLVIVDQNGHTITILTSIAGATGEGTNQVVIPLASLAGVTGLDIFTRGGNDSATFDLSANANSILGQFVTSTYDGGTNTAAGDKLRFIGDGVTSSVYTPDAATTGSGVVVVSSPAQTLTFNFLALEPVDFTGMAEAKLVTPSTATGADILTVAPGLDSLNGLLAALVVSGTVGGTTIESGYFFGNQSVVIVTDTGVDGIDSITILGASNSHGNTNLTIDTGSLGADSVQISGNVTLAGQLRIDTHLLSVQATVSLGGPTTFVTRGDTLFGAAGQLLSPQVAITAGGAITLADGSLINAGAGTIGLTATGHVTLGRLVTTNSTAAAVAVTSLTGSILDAGDSGGPNIVAEGLAAVVTLGAAQGVGSAASPLDLAVRQLVVTSSGDQYLSELDSLSSLNLNAGAANIYLTAGGQIQDSDAAIDLTAGQLVLSATSAGTAAQPLQTQLATLLATVSTDDLHLTESDGLTILPAAALAGNIGLRSLVGSLTIQSLQAQGLVTLAANTGAILSGTAGTNVTAADLELSAAAGVGTSASPLATQVQKLEALGGTGGIHVANQGNLQIGGISPSLLGLTGLSATGSDIIVAVIGTLTAVESIATTAAGQIILSATSDLIAQAAISSVAGPIALTSQRALRVENTTISSVSGAITLLANQGAIPAAGSFNGITLTSATISSATGNITLQGQGGAGGGHGVQLIGSSIGQTGSGDVLLAGQGTGGLADLAWDTLTLAKSGGTFTFQDTVQGSQLTVQPGAYQVRFLDGGIITQAVNFQNTGGVVLGNQDGDTLTFTGGITSTAGPTTIQGKLITGGTNVTLGSTTLVSTVTLQTGGGNVSIIGPISGAGVPLTINAGTGDVSLASPSNVIGNLTITADALTLFENDNITQGGAWTTTGPTVLNSGPFAIVLTNPANQFGPLSLTGASITVVEAGNTELAGVIWTGLLSIDASGQLLVSGPITGSGTAELSAGGNMTFATGGSLVATGGSANVTLEAGGAISLADGALINAGAGTIGLTANSHITLGRLLTTNSTAAAIAITSQTGSIVDGGDSGGPNIVAEGLSALVTISAAQGVGSAASPLDLAVRNLVVTSSGNQFLSELDNLSSLSLNAGSANIHLTAGGQIQDADGAVDITASQLVLSASSAGTAAQPLQTQLATLIANVSAGDLHLVDGDALVVISAAAPAGNISLRSLAGNLTIQMVQAQGLVTLAANSGAILSGAAGTNVTAADLELSAAAGVGTSVSPLATQVQKLEAFGGTGGIYVANQGNLQIGGISPSLLGLTGLSAIGSDIIVTVIGSLTAVEGLATTVAGSIDLSATSDLVVQAPVTTDAGSIGLTAHRALRVEGTNITSVSGPITLLANQGAIPAAGSFSGISLTNSTISSASGNITLQGQGGAGGGHGVLLIGSSVGQTGSGNVLLAGQGTGGLADLAWDTLTLAKSGGTFTFQDTVQGNQLIVQPGAYQVVFLDGGTITQAVSFQNTGGVLLGNANGDTITFAAGITSTAGPTTIQGTVITSGTNITLGNTTFVGAVTLLTTGGNVTIGPIQGASVPLTINAGAGNISLANPANQLGPLHLTGGNITVVETGDTELVFVAWAGLLSIDSSGNLLVSGPIAGNGTAQLTADGNVTFAPGTSLVATGGSANVAIQAGGAITLANGALINAGAGTIGLVANGNVTLGRLLTSNSTAAAVAVTSLAGSIVDGGDSGGPNIVAEGLGGIVTISAALGVGSAASPLDLAVRNLVVKSTTDQYLSELDNLSSLNLNAGSANIYLTAGGQIDDADGAVDITAAGLAIVAGGAGTLASPLQVALAKLAAQVGSGGLFVSDVGDLELGGVSSDIKGVQSSGGPIRIVVSGPILVSEAVQAAGASSVEVLAGGDITLAGPVSSENGHITLSATGDILASANGDLETAAGTILLLADSDNSGGGTIQFAGDIDVGTGQVIFRFPDADGLFSGSIHGVGGLVKQGPGTLTITATSINTYTGPTDLDGGTLRVDGVIGAAGPAGTFTLAGGTTLTGGGNVNAPIFSSSTTSRIESLGNLQLGDGSLAGFDFAGTLLVAGGHQVTIRDASLAQLGVLTMISSGGHLTALGGVEVGSHERLAGGGAVSGDILVLPDGVVTPGASPGEVSTAKGNVKLSPGSIYLVEVNGFEADTEYDQIDVQGTVIVEGAVLSLSRGGTFRPGEGTIFTLIENDGAEAVQGVFAGLAEGATVRFGGIEATISYVGGGTVPGTGNDVILTVTDLKIIRSITPDAAVRRDDTGGGGTSFTQRSQSVPVINVETARPVTVAQGTDARPTSLEMRSVERLRVFLKVVDEVTGLEEGKAIDLDPKVIDDVLSFFQRYQFPNGRYRIYVQEAGKSPRVIIEIAIRDGRAVSPEGQEAPAKEPAPAAKEPAQPAAPLPPDAASGTQAHPGNAAVETPRVMQSETMRHAGDGRAIVRSADVSRWSGVAASLAAGLAVPAAPPNSRKRTSARLTQSNGIPRTRFHRTLRKSPDRTPPPPT